MNKITNVTIAGLGGQGVLKASDILTAAVFSSGCDIKKSEVHGMSQRGGSVSSDIRFGAKVLSPMIPRGTADYLVVLTEDQVDNNIDTLREGGTLIKPDTIDSEKLTNKRSINVALLGVLSKHLDIAESCWHEAIRNHLPEKLFDVNIEAFNLGRR
ncbi:MAG: indolepyruvate oxidoreductase subunit beta [Phycisphaerae bacterium]|nr:indolepyruvate oxidoreductase subunit beta [Phycisphaerae bacterium]